MEDFNSEELQKFNQCNDPDMLNVETQYEWGEEYQRYVLGMLVNDTHFAISSQGLVKPNYFSNEVHRFVCRFVFDHHAKYGVLPKRLYVQQAIDEYVKEKDAGTKVFYRGELGTIYDYYLPGIEDREYLLDQITDFAKQQAMRVAMFKAMGELKKPNNPTKWATIQSLMQEAMSVDRNFDLGHDYFQSFRERYEQMQEAERNKDVFITGLPSIDSALQGGGMVRGEVGSWMGLPGSGKSLALVRCAIANLLRGRRVLYLSLEMNIQRVTERFDAMLVDPMQKYGVGINNLTLNKDIVFQALEDYSKDWDDKRMLIVKHFPQKSMDIPTFRAYYNQVKMRGFIPDMVLLDYIGEMKDYPGIPTYESRNRIIGELCGFADVEKVVLLTAMQPDKKAREVVRGGVLIDDDNLADAFGQSRPLHCLWSINRRQGETETNTGRVKVIKHRSGKSRHVFYVNIDPNTLRIEEISEQRWKEVNQNHALKKDVSRDEKNLEEIFHKKKKKDPILKDMGYNEVEGKAEP
jgi:hypothetical protein